MCDRTPFWSAYARLQRASSRRAHVSGYDWGIDAALDHLLEAVAANDTDAIGQVDRVISATRTREGHRAKLRSKYLVPREAHDPTPALHARLGVVEVFARVSGADADLLARAAIGADAGEVASAADIAPGTARVRLARLRKRLAA